MKVYFTASYEKENNYLHYAGILEKNNGTQTCTNGRLAGSEPETMVSAIGVALEQAKKTNESICFYTDLEDAVKWANGERKPIAKRIKDFVKYVKKTEETIGLTFESRIPDEMKPELERVASSYKGERQAEANPFKKQQSKPNWGSDWKQAAEKELKQEEQKQAPIPEETDKTPAYAVPKPYKGAMWGGFRVTVHDAKGKLFCDLDQNDFGQKNLADAVFFADWYEQESKNPDSFFYGVKVEKYNVPPRKHPQEQTKAKPITKPEPQREEKEKENEEQYEQIAMF